MNLDAVFSIIVFLSGLIIGMVLMWIIIKSKINSAYDKAKSESEAEKAILIERTNSKEQLLIELKNTNQTSSNEIVSLHNEISDISKKLSMAEEKNTRIPELQISLKERDDLIIELQRSLSETKSKISELDTVIQKERKATEEKLSILEDAQKKLLDTFKALSSDALNSNNEAFLKLAKTHLEGIQEKAKGDLELKQQSIDNLIKPVKETLDKVNTKMLEIEKDRTSSFATLTEQIKSLSTAQFQLQNETSNLVKALRKPEVRGRWGEVQLRRVVEFAGMKEHCDFIEQDHISTDDGDKFRPDMIIKLPGEKSIVIDSKTPLQAYLDALESQDDNTKIAKLKEHALQVKHHVDQLSSKAYWGQYNSSPEFVVLFLPGEMFFSAALESEPTLIEYAIERKVIISTPTTLIAMLKAVSYGWRQEKIQANSQEISNLGKILYERLLKFVGHYADIKKHLEQTIEAYNKSIGSLEQRVLVSARKFKELGASTGEDIKQIEYIDKSVRNIYGEDNA